MINNMESLSNDVLTKVLGYLNVRSASKLAKTNSSYRRVVEDNLYLIEAIYTGVSEPHGFDYQTILKTSKQTALLLVEKLYEEGLATEIRLSKPHDPSFFRVLHP